MSRKLTLIGVSALAILVISAYLPALAGDFVWDDEAHVTQNPDLRDAAGLKRIWTSERAVYYPLTSTFFWSLYQVWGARPFPFHILNIFFHLANALLLWFLLRRLNLPAAWLAAALFAIHPVQVESVAWITELKNLVSCFFFLLAAGAYIRSAGFPPNKSADQPQAENLRYNSRSVKGWMMEHSEGIQTRYVLSLFCFILSLLGKPAAILFPALIVLYHWWKKLPLGFKTLKGLAPFFLIAGLAAAWTIWEQKFHSGAIGETWSLTFAERIIVSGKAFWFYLGKVVWPNPLSFIYPRWEMDSRNPISYAGFALALLLFLLLWKSRRSAARNVLFALGYYGLMLFPVLGFFNVYYFRYSFVADHFQYLAVIGPIALASQILNRFKWAAVGTIAVCWILTWQGSARFQNHETLWRSTIRANPDAWLARNNLANLLVKRGRPSEAIGHYEEALRANPGFAEAHANLAAVLADQGKREEALRHLELALGLQPEFAEAHNNLGTVLLELDQTDQAIHHFEEAVRIKPDYAHARSNWSRALQMRKSSR